jgi:dihydrofolate synthase/folylpolyglutamate synthase
MDDSSELWEWLNAAQHRGVQPGLERMVRLLADLGNPERELRCLHVAGTNGKGSVCAFAESILRAAGHRTGFYSSPHLVDFSERIRINGQPASQTEIEEGIRRLRRACSSWRQEELPTYFELVTALAFDLFSRAGCEVVVLETGLGGRLDATNTAPKIACAITPIALDHQEWLGDSLAGIAREKAGILRPNIPAVFASQHPQAADALLLAAREMGVPCTWVTEPLEDNFTLSLAGSYQRSNAALALELVKAGGFHPSPEEIQQGLAMVSWPGRFHRVMGGRLILDGAHNPHAVRQLVETWREEYGTQQCLLIFGALADKAPQEMLAILEPIAEEIFLVPVASPRSLNPECYLGAIKIPHRILGSLPEALDLALKGSLKDDKNSQDSAGNPRMTPVLLTGSLFLVGEALSLESGAAFTPRSQ